MPIESREVWPQTSLWWHAKHSLNALFLCCLTMDEPYTINEPGWWPCFSIFGGMVLCGGAVATWIHKSRGLEPTKSVSNLELS